MRRASLQLSAVASLRAHTGLLLRFPTRCSTAGHQGTLACDRVNQTEDLSRIVQVIPSKDETQGNWRDCRKHITINEEIGMFT